MNERPTQADLDRWERLANEATPGPWTEYGRDVDHDANPDRDWGFISGLGCDLDGPPEALLDRGRFGHHADAAFIAEARTAVPVLIAEIERLREAWAAVGRAGNALGDLAATAMPQAPSGTESDPS